MVVKVWPGRFYEPKSVVVKLNPGLMVCDPMLDLGH